MATKDDRSKSKRSKMNQHNYRKATRNSTIVGGGGNTSSSSPREKAVRGVIDVAESSDEHFTDNRGWIRSKASGVAAQPSQRCTLEETLNDIDNLDNEQMHAPDFEEIAQMPASAGGHFRFESEKNWDLLDNQKLLDGTEASEYFTLNLKLLNVGLQTIPFYKRMDYPVGMFNAAQIKEMDKNAEATESSYQQILKEHSENVKSNKEKSALNGNVSGTAEQLQKVTINGEVDNKEKLAVPVAIPPEAQDIQEWLDNVLDE